MKPKCVKCNRTLKWRSFAHNQNICKNCFKAISVGILEKCYGRDERDAMMWLIALAAERFGYGW